MDRKAKAQRSVPDYAGPRRRPRVAARKDLARPTRFHSLDGLTRLLDRVRERNGPDAVGRRNSGRFPDGGSGRDRRVGSVQHGMTHCLRGNAHRADDRRSSEWLRSIRPTCDTPAWRPSLGVIGAIGQSVPPHRTRPRQRQYVPHELVRRLLICVEGQGGREGDVAIALFPPEVDPSLPIRGVTQSRCSDLAPGVGSGEPRPCHRTLRPLAPDLQHTRSRGTSAGKGPDSAAVSPEGDGRVQAPGGRGAAFGHYQVTGASRRLTIITGRWLAIVGGPARGRHPRGRL